MIDASRSAAGEPGRRPRFSVHRAASALKSSLCRNPSPSSSIALNTTATLRR
jgi:hypothetical protein